MREDLLLKGLTDEQIAKAKECKNPEEILAMAKEEGIELNDEQLEAVSGGCGGKPKKNQCVKCGKAPFRVLRWYNGKNDRVHVYYYCEKCGEYDCFGWKNEFDLD